MDMVGDGNSTNAGGPQRPPATNVFTHVALRSALHNRLLAKATKSEPVRRIFNNEPMDEIRDRALDAATELHGFDQTPYMPGNFSGLRIRALRTLSTR
ncbi:MAG TPA: hypothetical protein D7H94_02725 [Candidatus Poseidoniales archaeon]|nr:MAG TPA: hypothetical protein D7H94_02725 [Candidatus Poseidoniales archaeon]